MAITHHKSYPSATPKTRLGRWLRKVMGGQDIVACVVLQPGDPEFRAIFWMSGVDMENPLAAEHAATETAYEKITDAASEVVRARAALERSE